MPICGQCGTYTVRFPCTACGSEEKGKLQPKELKNTDFTKTMEQIFQEKDSEESNFIREKIGNDSITPSSGLPLPPIPIKSVNTTLQQQSKINSLHIKHNGFIFYPTKNTLEKFIADYQPIKIEEKLLLLYIPEQSDKNYRIEIQLSLTPVEWSMADPYPAFNSPNEEIRFQKTSFFVVLNSENASYSPKQLPELKKILVHPLFNILIFDERLAIHMDLDLPNYYYCRWTDLEEGFSWLINSLISRLVIKFRKSDEHFISPVSLPPPQGKLDIPINTTSSQDWKNCIKHGPSRPDTKFITCKSCNVSICLDCFKDIYHQMLCPGSLFRHSSYHEFGI